MWTFEQSTGKICHNGELKDTGYAGRAEGKNNPSMQNVPFIGPLPKGFYTFGGVKEGTHMGPFAIELIPDSGNEMFGRNAFFWHGDDGHGTASDGCIAGAPDVRKTAYKGQDRILQVI